VPLRIHTDDTREFRLGIAKLLATTLKIQHTTTMGHNPTGNAKAERPHHFLGVCLRILDDDEYYNLENHLDSIAHAWNTTMNANLGCSPFELHYGTAARSIPEAAFAAGTEAKTENQLSVAPVLESIRNHKNFFVKLAQKPGDFMWKLSNNKLNSKGRNSREFKVNDRVMIYVPPGHLEAKSRHRRAKHCLHFRGPGKITKILNDRKTAFEIKMEQSGDVFQRTIINIKRFPDISITTMATGGQKEDFLVNERGTVIVGTRVWPCRVRPHNERDQGPQNKVGTMV